MVFPSSFLLLVVEVTYPKAVVIWIQDYTEPAQVESVSDIWLSNKYSAIIGHSRLDKIDTLDRPYRKRQASSSTCSSLIDILDPDA